MATIRKRDRKWQVQVRRNGLFVSKSFHTQKDAGGVALLRAAKALDSIQAENPDQRDSDRAPGA
jgi:hypothetical protein